MKTIKLTVLLLILSYTISAQQLSGLWIGELINDSTQKKQHFELALSDYKGKVTGYSYTTFIEDDHYYYSIKRIKAQREDTVWIIEDDKMIANNFPEKAAKRVRQTTVFTLNKKNNTWQMNGQWKTNKTKRYYSLKGNVRMSEESDFSKSQLFPHLQELDPGNTVLLSKSQRQFSSTANVKASKGENIPAKIALPIKNTPAAKKNGGAVTKTGIPKKPDEEKEKRGQSTTGTGLPLVAGRSVQVIQTVLFKSDSLVLALYDNGEIDGDTVSVYLDNDIILSKEGLKAVAIKKTVYLKGMRDSIQLILFAENLGLYPPNTGLLVVHDGQDVYQIRFSADLERSPAIVFKRKKN